MAPVTHKKQTRSQNTNKTATDMVEKPRITLKYAKTTKSMGTRLSRNSQDADEEDLLLDAADQENATEEEPAAPRKAALPKNAASQKAPSRSDAADKNRKNKEALNSLLKTMIKEEMQKQVEDLDMSDDSSLPNSATVFARYLFIAPGQAALTYEMWMDKALEKVGSVPMDVAIKHGITSQVRKAMTETVWDQTEKTVYQFGRDAVKIINYVNQHR